MNQYDVVGFNNLNELISAINEYLKAGWKPAGEITQNTNGVYIQAIWREREV